MMTRPVYTVEKDESFDLVGLLQTFVICGLLIVLFWIFILISFWCGQSNPLAQIEAKAKYMNERSK